jgi:Mediator complex subunit 16
VLSQRVIRSNTLIVFSMSDGSIQFRWRESMELISPDENHDEVRTLSQAGFAFPADEPGEHLHVMRSGSILISVAFHTALSPNACVAAVIRNNEVRLNKMEYSIGKFDELKEDDRK